MLKNKRWLLVGVIAAMLVMAACAAPTPTTTEAPATAAPTEAMTEAPTAAPTEAAPAGPVGDCDAQNAAGATSPMKSIEATDDHTVVFTLCNTDPAFINKIAIASMGIYSAAQLESTGGTGELLEKPLGTGPYVVSDWKKGESLTLTRNDKYWGDKAKTATLIFQVSTDATARLTTLKSGDADGIDNVAPTDFDTVKNDSTLQLTLRPGVNLGYLGMNNKYPPFNDVHVRRAVAQAIDRDRYLKFFPAGSTVANFFTPCVLPHGCSGDPWYKFDPAAAKAELQLADDAAVRNGFATKLYLRDASRAYQPQPQQMAQDLKDQLKANLNVDVTIEIQDSPTFLSNAANGKLDGLVMIGWIADYPHITDYLDYHFGANGKRFGDPYADIYNLLGEASKLTDADKADALYVQANAKVKELAPMVPLVNGVSGVAWKADVVNPNVSPLSLEVFDQVDPGGRDTFVFIQNAEPPGLYCADETDGEAVRVCNQINESLYRFKPGTLEAEPALATECAPDADLKVWTCKIRENVTFSDGSPLTANDVVQSFTVQWDASNPLHKGNTGTYEFFDLLFGIINKPAS
jgi:peptide/nickel transport system substrate-binding protein